MIEGFSSAAAQATVTGVASDGSVASFGQSVTTVAVIDSSVHALINSSASCSSTCTTASAIFGDPPGGRFIARVSDSPSGVFPQIPENALYASFDTMDNPPPPPTSVPEPSTLVLLGAGLIGLGWARRRTRADARH